MTGSLASTRRLALDAFRATTPIRIGAEVEWLVFHEHDLTRAVGADTTACAAEGVLPAGGTVSIEPGGQLELATLPFSSPEQLLGAIDADTRTLVSRFRDHGLLLVALGLDPFRPARCSLPLPKYEAMEAYFAARSPAGVRMMSLTASLQLNVDFGPDPLGAWIRANAIAPALLAAFANSPTVDGAVFGSASQRQQIWAATDPSRTRRVAGGPDAWVDYVLDAQVMLRSRSERLEPQLDELTLRAWLQAREPPSAAEVALHVSTLFPPLRPRGYLEFRMLDALTAGGRAAAVTMVWALLTDEDAGRRAAHACLEVPDLWERAVSQGLDDDAVRDVAAHCLELATGVAPTRSSPRAEEVCREWRDAHVLAPERSTVLDELVTTRQEPGG